MKRAGSLPGLIVLSLKDSEVLGAIRRGVEDPYFRRMLAFAFEDDEWYDGPKVLPFNAIESIGLNAVIVKDPSQIMNMDLAADVRLNLKQKESLIEKHIMTAEGRYVGEIFDYAFDEDNGMIGEYYLHRLLAGDELCYRFPAEKTIRVGKELVIVEDSPMIETDVRPVKKRPWAWIPEDSIAQHNIADQQKIAKALSGEETKSEKTSNTIETISLFDDIHTKEPKSKEEKLRQDFEKHHYAYLLGRKADRDIRDDDGTLIIKKGQFIDETAIRMAKKSGKFSQLAISSRQRR